MQRRKLIQTISKLRRPTNSRSYRNNNTRAIEASNVDIAEEFTEMIIASRSFQANSKIISTSDEILQEIINLKR